MECTIVLKFRMRQRVLLQITIDGLSRLLCMEQRKNITRAKSRPDHVTHHVTHVIGGSADKRKSHHEKTIKSPVLPYNKWEPPITTPRFQHADSPLATQPCTASYFFEIAEQSSKAESSLIEMEVKEIKRILKNFTNKLLARDTKERNAMEWRLVALSIDRLFFAIYLLTIFVSTVTIYVMCYIYYDNTKHEEEKGHQWITMTNEESGHHDQWGIGSPMNNHDQWEIRSPITWNNLGNICVVTNNFRLLTN